MTELAHILPVEIFVEHAEHHATQLAEWLKNPDQVIAGH